MRKWRVAILGLGHWYSAFGLARALPEYPRAELVAAAWHDKAQLDAFTGTFGIDGYTDYDALLEHERIDIVHIAAPVSELADLTIKAARAGKHMVLGKPMAMTVEQADRMVEAVETAGVTCFPFQGIMRLRDAELKARIDKGEIGDIVLLHQTSRWSIAEDWYNSGKPGWFVDPRHVPGGAFIDEGIYWIDLFRWLAGSEIVAGRGEDREPGPQGHRRRGLGDGDVHVRQRRHRDAGSVVDDQRAEEDRAVAEAERVVRLEVIGTRGEIIDQWFRAPGRAVLAAGAADWVFERQSEPPFTPPPPFPLSHLIDCLENNQTPAATIRDARRSLVGRMAAYESARDRDGRCGCDFR